MPQQRQNDAGRPVEITATTPLWREVARGIALPVAFTYRETPAPGAPLVTLHMRVDDDRQLLCERVEIQPSDTAPLTAQNLRFAYGEMVRRAGVRAAMPVTFSPHDENGHFRPDRLRIKITRRILDDGTHATLDTDGWIVHDPSSRQSGSLADRWESMSSTELVDAVLAAEAATKARPLSDHERDAATTATTALPRRRRLLADEEITGIANEYRALVALGHRDPTEQIRLKHHVSRTTASRWIRRARELGALEPA